MALFFMRTTESKIYTSLLFLSAPFLVVDGVVYRSIGVSLLIMAQILIMFRVMDLEKTVNEKDKAMGIRLIDGMKALTELCKNAFDHIKTNKQQIEKIGPKISEYNSRIQRLENKNNRISSQKTDVSNKKNLNID